MAEGHSVFNDKGDYMGEANVYSPPDPADAKRLAELEIEIRRLRDCIVSARWRLAKGRALWNGPCHECDAALERGLTGADIRGRASNAELAVLDASAAPPPASALELRDELLECLLLHASDFPGNHSLTLDRFDKHLAAALARARAETNTQDEDRRMIRQALPIEAALIRNTERRLLMLMDELETYIQQDPMRRELESRINATRQELNDRLRNLRIGE